MPPESSGIGDAVDFFDQAVAHGAHLPSITSYLGSKNLERHFSRGRFDALHFSISGGVISNQKGIGVRVARSCIEAGENEKCKELYTSMIRRLYEDDGGDA